MKLFKRLYDYFFPKLTLSERVSLWLKSIGKSDYYGMDVEHKDLDLIKFKSRRFRYFKK